MVKVLNDKLGGEGGGERGFVVEGLIERSIMGLVYDEGKTGKINLKDDIEVILVKFCINTNE